MSVNISEIVDMQPVEFAPEHPLTNAGTRNTDELCRAKQLASVAIIRGSVFSQKISNIQRRLLSGAYVDGIEIHQFLMHAEIELTEEDILMGDALLDATGVGPSGDVPVSGSTYINEDAFEQLRLNPRFEARVNPDDPSQIGVLHLDNGKCVKVQAQRKETEPVS